MAALFKAGLTFGAILFIIFSNNTFAGKRKIGSFELAHRGTLFLDSHHPRQTRLPTPVPTEGGAGRKAGAF